MGTTTNLQPARVIEELRELQDLTGTSEGAQRVAWTDTWLRAREWMREKLSSLPVEVELDEAGNQWATLPGRSSRTLLIGGHIDSVPNGGWLDGCLNVLAGVEVLRRLSSEGEPAVTVKLLDWADEEGARFGRSLLGSSAAAGSLDVEAARVLRDQDDISLPEALSRCGIDIDRMRESRRRLEDASAYLELHIEQGPVLERLELPLGVVLGTCGVERHAITFTGQASHAGSTPMDVRRDAFAAAARFALSVREPAARVGAVATVGRVAVTPNIPTAVAGECTVALDQRHLDGETLASLLAEAREASEQVAAEERVEVAWERIWRIDPIPFHPALIELADETVRAVAGASHRLPSGPLHDAAEMARAGVPTVMLFVQSRRGLSHTPLEDTDPAHIELSVRALDRLASRTIEWIGEQG